MGPKANKIQIRSGRTNCVTFKPGGYHLVGAGNSGYLRQWRVDNGEEISPTSTTTNVTTSTITAVAASMDGRWIVSGDTQATVIIWNAVTHTIVKQISEHTGHVYAVDVSSDSTRVASGSYDRTLQIFNIISGDRVIPPLTHDDAVVGVKFSPDGHRIATVTRDIIVTIYDAQSGNRLFDIPVQTRAVVPIAWSFDGQQLFTVSPGKITCFDTSTSTSSEWLIQNSNSNVSVVTHGRFIACSAGPSISFWDYSSCKQIGSLVNHSTAVICISISHDGRYLACGHNQGITVHSLGDFFPRDYPRMPRVSRFPLMQMSDVVLESWALGNPMDTELMLSNEITQSSDPSHHMFAARSLIQARLREWKAALEDAEKSLEIEQSPIGQISRSLALVGAGEQEIALDDFDFAFRDGDPNDTMLLLVIKSILVFICGKRKHAVSRLRGLITTADEKTKWHYIQVLGNMYLKQGDYQNAVQILELAKKPSTPSDADPLITISFIFNWNFDRLKATAWQCLCESLHVSGRIKEVGETLLQMVSPLAEDEKEPAHGRILEDMVMRLNQVTLLAWTGKSSKCNSCLPSSPGVYSQQPFLAPFLEEEELGKRTDELRAVFPLADALVIYGRITRLQPVRFAHFRLHLPCIVFGVKSLRKEQDDVYHAETSGLGDVEFTTADMLPLKEPRRLFFVDLRIHSLLEAHGTGAPTSEYALESDAEWNSSDMGSSGADTDAELVHTSIIEEVTSAPQIDAYTRALQLIAHLGQPFSALLLLRQSDGAYKRVAADHEIVVRGTGKDVPKDIRVEVLEIL